MTDQEINVAIAEACGWIAAPNADGDLTESHLTRTWIEWLGPHGEQESEPPNYCGDLNAIHEAEKVLKQEQWECYEFLLRDAVTRNEAGHPWSPRDIHATARQRAEAFLRALGKWREE